MLNTKTVPVLHKPQFYQVFNNSKTERIKNAIRKELYFSTVLQSYYRQSMLNVDKMHILKLGKNRLQIEQVTKPTHTSTNTRAGSRAHEVVLLNTNKNNDVQNKSDKCKQ